MINQNTEYFTISTLILFRENHFLENNQLPTGEFSEHLDNSTARPAVRVEFPLVCCHFLTRSLYLVVLCITFFSKVLHETRPSACSLNSLAAALSDWWVALSRVTAKHIIESLSDKPLPDARTPLFCGETLLLARRSTDETVAYAVVGKRL